jgi:dimeric dUTPase (all-alpha-NTP-PPase superfamily)
MNLKYMIELQGGLMEHIKKAKGLDVIPLNDTVFALLVELGELANEVKFFKYWSKNNKPTEKTLEEYIDGLHFVLQIGILGGFDFSQSLKHGKWLTLQMQFSDLFKRVAAMTGIYGSYNEGAFKKILELYLSLGEMLGFTPEEIEKAYLEKNKVNHERQRDGY